MVAVRIEILLFDGFDELDVFGPFEALDSPGFDVALVTLDSPRQVRSQRGVRIDVPEVLGRPDGVVVPGGGWLNRAEQGSWAEVQRGAMPAALREQAAAGAWLASVCTGAFLLGTAGLLQGRDATTNRNARVELEPYAGRVLDERVVDDGDRITAAGLTAGIDLGLHLVERFAGTAAADARAEGLEYDRLHRAWRAAPEAMS